MRTSLLAVLLFACTYHTIEPCPRMPLIISDSLPVQFWVNGEETFNEKDVCGMVKQDCFCQPFQCDDDFKVQFQSDAGLGYVLAVFAEDDSLVAQFDFEEINEGIYQVSFDLNSSPCDQKVKFVIQEVSSLGQTWTSFELAANGGWSGVAYGNGVFVTVRNSNLGDQVMISNDGEIWETRPGPTVAGVHAWTDVTFGNGLFVAVCAASVSGDHVMTSTDGETWVVRNTDDRDLYGVTYGEGLFVAIAQNGTGDRVITSPDGITWTLRSSAADLLWTDITYGEGLFVAVAYSGTGNRVMTSPDGIIWTSQTSAADNSWTSVSYGNGWFVAVSADGTNRVMRSNDGIIWTNHAAANNNNDWSDIAFGNGVFVAVAPKAGSSGSTDLIMTSTDGASWVSRTNPAQRDYSSVTYGEGYFIALSNSTLGSGTTNGAIKSYTDFTEVATSDCIDVRESHDCSILIEYENTSDFDGIAYEDGSPGPSFQLRIPAIFFEEENPQEQEDLELSNGVIVTLRQTIVEKRKLETGFMPNYMHRKLQKVLMHDSVYIDGDYWKKRDAYDTSPVKKYNLKTAEVLLTKYDSVEKNTI